MHKFLQKALKLIDQHEYDAKIEFRLCAIIVRGGSIISIGYNDYDKVNGFVRHYTDKVRAEIKSNRNCHSAHAEMVAVNQARAKTDLRGCKVFVARRSPTGSAMSRPCPICQKVLYEYGIKTAYYTINENEYGVMKIVDSNNVKDQIFDDADFQNKE